MTKIEFIRAWRGKLPITWKDGYRSYFEAVRELGQQYILALKNIDESEFFEGGRILEEHTKSEVITLAENVLTTVLTSLKVYLENGSPGHAYEIFNDHFSASGIFKGKAAPVRALGYTALYPESYRIRESSNVLSSPTDLFHVPFEERYKVKSWRYSISGLPTLYLANSVYVAVKELEKENFNELYVSRFFRKGFGTEIKAPQLLDLRNEFHFEGDRYLARWPLIMACSMTVAEPDFEARPEYILPQILLQWIRRKIKVGIEGRRVIGVAYSSSKIPIHSPGFGGDFYNIAIPVEKAGEYGYCSMLKDLFLLTAPISCNAALNTNIKGQQAGQVSSIIDANNNKVRYSDTDFGRIETVVKKDPYNKLYSL